jgi:hypothetical protein
LQCYQLSAVATTAATTAAPATANATATVHTAAVSAYYCVRLLQQTFCRLCCYNYASSCDSAHFSGPATLFALLGLFGQLSSLTLLDALHSLIDDGPLLQ